MSAFSVNRFFICCHKSDRCAATCGSVTRTLVLKGVARISSAVGSIVPFFYDKSFTILLGDARPRLLRCPIGVQTLLIKLLPPFDKSIRLCIWTISSNTEWVHRILLIRVNLLRRGVNQKWHTLQDLDLHSACVLCCVSRQLYQALNRMATLPDLYQHLLSGRNLHITNKRYNVSKVVNGFTMIDPTFSNDEMFQEGIELSRQGYKLYKEGLEFPEDSPESSAKIHESAKLYKDALRKLHRYEYDVLKKMKEQTYYDTYVIAHERGASHEDADEAAMEKVNQITWKLPIKIPQSKKIKNAIRALEDDALFTLSPTGSRNRR